MGENNICLLWTIFCRNRSGMNALSVMNGRESQIFNGVNNITKNHHLTWCTLHPGITECSNIIIPHSDIHLWLSQSFSVAFGNIFGIIQNDPLKPTVCLTQNCHKSWFHLLWFSASRTVFSFSSFYQSGSLNLHFEVRLASEVQTHVGEF